MNRAEFFVPANRATAARAQNGMRRVPVVLRHHLPDVGRRPPLSAAHCGHALAIMPASSGDFREAPVTFDFVQRVRELFRTSITATAISLVELAEFPAMLICNAQGKRLWFCRGNGVPERLFPSERPGRASRVARMRLQVGEREQGTVCADEWFDLPAARGHEVHEDSIVVMPARV